MADDLWVPTCSCKPSWEWICMVHEKKMCKECYEKGRTIMGRKCSPEGKMTHKTIFLNTGRTFTFRNVVNIIENETSLTFNYTAMSDGELKTVIFYRPEIVGHSTYVFRK